MLHWYYKGGWAEVDKKKIGAGFAGALQKAADATKAVKLAVQDMAADAKQSREKKKADVRMRLRQRN